MPERLQSLLAAWLLRLTTGFTLLFYAELLWWGNDPLHYSPLEWPGLAILYVAMGALLLDLTVRYSVADVFGLALLGGVFAVLNGLLISHHVFSNWPLSAVTQVMGVRALAGSAALLLMSWVFDRRVVMWRFAAAGVMGLAAGVWIRWFPEGNGQPVPTLETATLLLLGGMALLYALAWLNGKFKLTDEADLRLGKWEWLLVGGVLGAALLLALLQGVLPVIPALLMLLLSLGLIAVLYAQQAIHLWSTLDDVLPPRPVELQVYVMYSGLVLLLMSSGYGLPAAPPEPPQIQLLGYGFLLLGFLWVPVVSAWVGFRAYREQLRQRREAEHLGQQPPSPRR